MPALANQGGAAAMRYRSDFVHVSVLANAPTGAPTLGFALAAGILGSCDIASPLPRVSSFELLVYQVTTQP